MLKYIGEGVNYIQGAPKRDITDEELAEMKEKNLEVHDAILKSGFWEDDSKKKAKPTPTAKADDTKTDGAKT